MLRRNLNGIVQVQSYYQFEKINCTKHFYYGYCYNLAPIVCLRSSLRRAEDYANKSRKLLEIFFLSFCLQGTFDSKLFLSKQIVFVSCSWSDYLLEKETGAANTMLILISVTIRPSRVKAFLLLEYQY